jgi:hypothetical protein
LSIPCRLGCRSFAVKEESSKLHQPCTWIITQLNIGRPLLDSRDRSSGMKKRLRLDVRLSRGSRLPAGFLFNRIPLDSCSYSRSWKRRNMLSRMRSQRNKTRFNAVPTNVIHHRVGRDPHYPANLPPFTNNACTTSRQKASK